MTQSLGAPERYAPCCSTWKSAGPTRGGALCLRRPNPEGGECNRASPFVAATSTTECARTTVQRSPEIAPGSACARELLRRVRPFRVALFDDQLVGVVEPHVDGAAVGLRHLDLPGGAVPRISLHGVRASTPRRLEGRGGGPIRLRAADLLGGVVLGLARLVRRLGISRTSAPGDWPVPWSRPEAAPAMADPPRPRAAKAATPIRMFFNCLVMVLLSS